LNDRLKLLAYRIFDPTNASSIKKKPIAPAAPIAPVAVPAL
jgi:hypothetical protein